MGGQASKLSQEDFLFLEQETGMTRTTLEVQGEQEERRRSVSGVVRQLPEGLP